MEQRDEDPRAGAADRMSERNGAAVDVQALAGDRQVARARRAPAARRLRSAPPDRSRRAERSCASSLLNRGHRADAHPPRIDAGTGPPEHPREWRQPVLRDRVVARQHHRGAAVGDARRRPRRDDAWRAHRARTPAAACAGLDVVVARMFVGGDRLAALRVGTSTGAISSANAPVAIARAAFSWLTSANASDASRVMPYSRARSSAVSPMTMPRERAREAVAIHRVDERKVPHPVAPARIRRVDQIGHAAHRLDAAGQDDLRFAEQDLSPADAIASIPDAHALFIVVAGTVPASPADGRPAAQDSAPSRPAGMADECLVDQRGFTPARHGRARGDGAELRGVHVASAPPYRPMAYARRRHRCPDRNEARWRRLEVLTPDCRIHLFWIARECADCGLRIGPSALEGARPAASRRRLLLEFRVFRQPVRIG